MLARIRKFFGLALAIGLEIIFPLSNTEEIIHRIDHHPEPPRQPPFPWISALYSYRDPLVRRALTILKKRKSPVIAARFAATLEYELIQQITEIRQWSNAPMIITSIPLPTERMRERGYNQVDTVVRTIQNSDITKLIQYDVLSTTPSPRKQSTIKNRSERFANRKGCFSVKNPDRVAGAHIIIIDDITTSGATLSEAKQTLASYQSASVRAITLAH